jgi:predicted small lipoprotein YifL
MKRVLALAALACASLLLAACGQRGPLTLPDAGKQSVPQADAPPPASHADDEKKKTGKPPTG